LFALEDPMNQHTDVRLSLPSKGRLAQAAQDFLAACGLGADKPKGADDTDSPGEIYR